METLRDIVKKRKVTEKQRFEPKRNPVKGIMVGIDDPDTPEVTNRPGFAWVKENGQAGGLFQCFNPSVKMIVGLPVIVGRGSMKSSLRYVESVDWDALSIAITSQSTEGALGIPRHHRDHEWPTMYPGVDAVSVYNRAIVPCKLFIGAVALTISVSAGVYYSNGQTVAFAGLSNDDISGYVPTTAGNYVILLVYINPNTNLVEYLLGIEINNPNPVEPTVPANMFAIGYMRLQQGMTAIVEHDIVDDMRPLFSIDTAQLSAVNDYCARIEAEFDYELSRHIVGG